jgi:DNA-directed RNA polymerase subunit N (RpoN/RPB10)
VVYSFLPLVFVSGALFGDLYEQRTRRRSEGVPRTEVIEENTMGRYACRRRSTNRGRRRRPPAKRATPSRSRPRSCRRSNSGKSGRKGGEERRWPPHSYSPPTFTLLWSFMPLPTENAVTGWAKALSYGAQRPPGTHRGVVNAVRGTVRRGAGCGALGAGTPALGAPGAV